MRNDETESDLMQFSARKPDRPAILAFLVMIFLALPAASAAWAADMLPTYLAKVQPAELFAGADRFGDIVGEPPIASVYRGEQLLGYAYLNSDFTNSIGYSGKPIHIAVGIDPKGVVRGFKLIDHHEPIVLVGIPQAKVVAAVNSIIGKDLKRVAAGTDHPPQVDIVSGATVTVLVMNDSIVRSAVSLIRSGRLDKSGLVTALASTEVRKLDLTKDNTSDWHTLLADGSIRSLHLTVGDVSKAFQDAKHPDAAARPEMANPEGHFIDLYVAPVSVPAIGKTLLGEDAYRQMMQKLSPGQSAILVAGDGAYSFKGSAYVRGGIFDRIELLQNDQGVRFRDRNHTRLSALAPSDAPDLKDVDLFIVPAEFSFDVTEPWELQLLVQRSVGARDKQFIPFDLGYTLPSAYYTVTKATAAAPAVVAAKPVVADVASDEQPLWMRIWNLDRVSIAITTVALLILTAIFFFQDWLVKRPRLFAWVRNGYLLFTLVWLGWYAGAQLSVVNVLTFTNALITNFSWEFFLAAPLIFILWAAVAAGLLFWGRGPFCGWLCPFGALQELLAKVAQRLKVPQVKLPWGLHERLWPIKYIIFLGLFGMSFYSMSNAEMLAEVEPFKTAIVLKFVRDWPFVVFAVVLLVASLFIERFYCRYLCPLGAALAIPGRIRMFEWLKRYPDCGSPCQRCSKECPVQAIHPEGQINVNECIYCMHCQELYHDDQRCPHMIQVRLKREKFKALSTPESRGEKSGPKTVITHNGEPVTRS
jgi:NosR/NirI family nitrous oxide reductase transcriptional regulator